ncbi:MAG TPA: YfbK domain-containing protein, partial [Planctomycetota bacterium]|nr:YfbK domain-containing protein [Planctomycetota bacterium]
YDVAQRAFRAGEINRVILCSDGVANIGITEADDMLKKVGTYRDHGITFTSIGFGMGSYNDELLEKLANKGDGSYMFVDSRQEAQRVFVDELAATLQTIAKDAKIQVEFNPARVRRYRLIGYENRDIADKDFRNDAIDAGEVGSGQSATALYELELYEWAGDLAADAASGLGTVYVRYRNVDTGKVEEISHRLAGGLVSRPTPQTAGRFFLAAAAAEFAELLRESEHAKDGDINALRRLLQQAAVQLPLDNRVQELLELVTRANGLPRAR